MYGANSHSFYTHDFQPVPSVLKDHVDDIMIANGLDNTTRDGDERFLGADLASLPHEAQQEVIDRVRGLGLAVGINATRTSVADPDPALVALAFTEESD